MYAIDTYPAEIRLGTDPITTRSTCSILPLHQRSLMNLKCLMVSFRQQMRAMQVAGMLVVEIMVLARLRLIFLPMILSTRMTSPSTLPDGVTDDDESKDDFLGNEVDRGELDVTDEMLSRIP